MYNINDIINNWKIIEILPREPRKARKYICECQCEDKTIRTIEEPSLKRNLSKSCGCLSKLKFRQALIGQVFNKLFVIEYSGITAQNKILWKCVCECGEYCEVTTADLKSGHVKSCGHLIFEAKTSLHNMSKSPEYYCYYKMIARCYNPNHHQFKNYGARGIKVCDRWLNKESGFINFLQDMGLRPGQEYSIERINNDGNYEPFNCKWDTSENQNRNNRNVVIGTMQDANDIRNLYKTGSYTYSELADIYGCTTSNISAIIRNRTWV